MRMGDLWSSEATTGSLRHSVLEDVTLPLQLLYKSNIYFYRANTYIAYKPNPSKGLVIKTEVLLAFLPSFIPLLLGTITFNLVWPFLLEFPFLISK